MQEAKFDLISGFHPQGDQPQAIEKLTEGIRRGLERQTLIGVTGSGKTFLTLKKMPPSMIRLTGCVIQPLVLCWSVATPSSLPASPAFTDWGLLRITRKCS